MTLNLNLKTDRRHYVRFLELRARRIWFRALLHGNRAVPQEWWQAVEEYTMTAPDPTL